MRNIISINKNWKFSKNENDWENINLPHTWNNVDGQDGGSDYYRGKCVYKKILPVLSSDTKKYIQFNGANSSCEVFLNEKKVGEHHGGYSNFIIDITDCYLADEENKIVVLVDNSPNEEVYPQNADFTFYGGIYRDVNLIELPKCHIGFDKNGGNGVWITPILDDELKTADINFNVTIKNGDASKKLKTSILALDGSISGLKIVSCNLVNEYTIHLDEVILWDGKINPYLYTAKIELLDESDTVIDSVETKFGCRKIEIDSEKGFMLNNKKYPLRGVAKHQDYKGVGNAITKQMIKGDIDIIDEMGATTVRLAHYQHDSYVYDLCDEYGLIVWAEIPYISRHMEAGVDNTISQMSELVEQNYNHPSIVVWGLSNEITMMNDQPESRINNHVLLNDLVKKMDPTRYTSIAVVSMCGIDDPYIQIPDVVSWNYYFGWYDGKVEDNATRLDEFHTKYPTIPVGISEYGADCNTKLHSSDPKPGDYTEEYQARYHEQLVNILYLRDYIWATHVWNMFDFGADNRDEGDSKGQNNKGLVSFDRAYKKDSFYVYKSWLSNKPFVHIAGKNYVDRVEENTEVTVYSNLHEVELFANGEFVEKKCANDHFFKFQIRNSGTTNIKAIAKGKIENLSTTLFGDTADTFECVDESHICKVDEPNKNYVLSSGGVVINWFDVTAPEGYFSINSKISAIWGNEESREICKEILSFLLEDSIRAGRSDKNTTLEEFAKGVGTFALLRMSSFMMKHDKRLTKEFLLDVNTKLNLVENK